MNALVGVSERRLWSASIVDEYRAGEGCDVVEMRFGPSAVGMRWCDGWWSGDMQFLWVHCFGGSCRRGRYALAPDAAAFFAFGARAVGERGSTGIGREWRKLDGFGNAGHFHPERCIDRWKWRGAGTWERCGVGGASHPQRCIRERRGGGVDCGDGTGDAGDGGGELGARLVLAVREGMQWRPERGMLECSDNVGNAGHDEIIGGREWHRCFGGEPRQRVADSRSAGIQS